MAVIWVGPGLGSVQSKFPFCSGDSSRGGLRAQKFALGGPFGPQNKAKTRGPHTRVADQGPPAIPPGERFFVPETFRGGLASSTHKRIVPGCRHKLGAWAAPPSPMPGNWHFGQPFVAKKTPGNGPGKKIALQTEFTHCLPVHAHACTHGPHASAHVMEAIVN